MSWPWTIEEITKREEASISQHNFGAQELLHRLLIFAGYRFEDLRTQGQVALQS